MRRAHLTASLVILCWACRSARSRYTLAVERCTVNSKSPQAANQPTASARLVSVGTPMIRPAKTVRQESKAAPPTTSETAPAAHAAAATLALTVHEIAAGSRVLNSFGRLAVGPSPARAAGKALLPESSPRWSGPHGSSEVSSLPVPAKDGTVLRAGPRYPYAPAAAFSSPHSLRREDERIL